MADRPTFTLVLADAAPEGDAPPAVRLRALLKRALRTYCFRCTLCVEGDVARTKFLLVKCTGHVPVYGGGVVRPLELTPPAAVVQVEASLAALAKRINQNHEAGCAELVGSLERFRDVGIDLVAVRERTKASHAWMKWLKDNVKFAQRTAYNYITLAENWDRITPVFATVANTGLREALNRIAELLAAEDTTKDYYTLEEWQALTDEDREKALAVKDASKHFNAQGDNEGIEWALWSWNPVTGCEHNCPYCYARDIAERFYDQKFAPSIWPARLRAPENTPFPEAKATEWMGHKNVFTCSMADLFGRWVPREWIDAVLGVVREAPRWNFLFLTKFPQRMAEFDFPDNAWVGTTVDCQVRVKNAEKAFRKIKAGVKWLSCEPLIEPLTFADIGAFDWVVLGGASQSSQTPEWHPPRAWVNAVEDAAQAAGVQFYEKSNLLRRIRSYPGLPATEPQSAPEPLRYLPEAR